ncbi:MAG: phage BR0599 family protein, partial [Pseudomonadota bacterium]|nr:phage BR0599 family protein [Pseudomonadota bacterium]
MIFLFKIDSLRYTTAPKAQVHEGETYEPHAITDIQHKGEGDKPDELTFKVRGDSPVLNSVKRTVDVLCDYNGEAHYLFSGETVKLDKSNRYRKKTDQAKVTCNNVLRITEERIPLMQIQKTSCPLTLGHPRCGVNLPDFTLVTTVSGIDGNSVTLADAVSLHHNYINEVSQTFNPIAGTVITLTDTTGLEVGQTVTILPFCDHSIEACENTFNNVNNYQGCPNMPEKNPHS